ncbi:MAG: hypothetical protein ABIJ08_04830 [Nanoarchaeota archaeon]
MVRVVRNKDAECDVFKSVKPASHYLLQGAGVIVGLAAAWWLFGDQVVLNSNRKMPLNEPGIHSTFNGNQELLEHIVDVSKLPVGADRTGGNGPLTYNFEIDGLIFDVQEIYNNAMLIKARDPIHLENATMGQNYYLTLDAEGRPDRFDAQFLVRYSGKTELMVARLYGHVNDGQTYHIDNWDVTDSGNDTQSYSRESSAGSWVKSNIGQLEEGINSMFGIMVTNLQALVTNGTSPAPIGYKPFLTDHEKALESMGQATDMLLDGKF